ncbi:cysteine desulfurase [Sesbania bispinosa]|nr:cysteine desulfurase [Sesbania bispinosa]
MSYLKAFQHMFKARALRENQIISGTRPPYMFNNFFVRELDNQAPPVQTKGFT